MKKLLLLLSLFLLVGCMKDDFIEPINLVEIPESLVIEDLQGLKLESTIVSSEVRMNVKLPYTGDYRIKIRNSDKDKNFYFNEDKNNISIKYKKVKLDIKKPIYNFITFSS